VQARRVDLPTTPVTTDQIAPGIERIRIATFSKGVGAAVAAAVTSAKAAHVRGLVLDLRGNPGGLLDEAVSTASAFLDGGPVVSLHGRTVPEQTLDASRGGDTATPLAVLVDGGTASAAEVLAGALSDRGRGVLVGSKTFGKGSVQQLTRLKDGSELEITVAEYRTPNGRVVDGVGLTPDVQVDPQADPQVASDLAVSLLQGLISTSGA
jgi:carboxyl-terminal processing protease